MLKLNRSCWFVAYWLVWVIARARFRMRLESAVGRLDGPALIVGKHQSYWDVPFLAWAMRKTFRRGHPCFEMGSFHGYKGLRHGIWLFERIGGFPVMRPKDLIRLKKMGDHTKDELTAIMRRVNDEAAATRREVLRRGHALCFFPEGARDPERVGRLVSTLELDDALRHIEEEKADVPVLPVVPCFGRRPRRLVPFLSRQPVTVKVLEPIRLAALGAPETLERIRRAFEASWVSRPS